jgi:hypothetical protein
MTDIAGCQGLAVAQRLGGELSVFDRHRRVGRHDPPPAVGGLGVEGEDPRAVLQHKGPKPGLRPLGVGRMRRALALDAPS